MVSLVVESPTTERSHRKNNPKPVFELRDNPRIGSNDILVDFKLLSTIDHETVAARSCGAPEFEADRMSAFVLTDMPLRMIAIVACPLALDSSSAPVTVTLTGANAASLRSVAASMLAFTRPARPRSRRCRAA
jgi:hypothetical protein